MRAASLLPKRALKALRERVRPDFGFNLHDQGARTLAGARGPQVGIALLAPPTGERGGYDPTRQRARLVAATIARVVQHEIPGRVAKYDDAFNPRAFGDLMQAWGTSTVLIESGALPDDPEKQRLRTINVIAILSALDAIATGSYRTASESAYDALPYNRSGASDMVVRGGQVVLEGQPPVPLDFALSYEDAVSRTGLRLRDVGDLGDVVALDTVDARGLFIHPEPPMLAGGGRVFRLGSPAALTLRRGAGRESEVVRRIGAP